MKTKAAITPVTKTPADTKAVTVELKGVTYTLRHDFNSVCEVELESNVNLLHGMRNWANLSTAQLRGLFAAAVRAADPKSKMTAEQAGELIGFGDITPVSEAVAASIIASMAKSSTSPAPAV